MSVTGSTQVTWRRGTQSQVSSFIGATGEIVVDTTNNRIVIQDGNTLGGHTGCNISDLNTSINNLSGYVNTIALSGTPNVVYTTGNQIINGNKTFNNPFNINPQNNNTNSLTLSNSPFYINTYTGLVTWTLPTISSSTGRLYFIKNIGYPLTLTGQGSDKIFSTQPVLSFIVYSGESYNLANDGNFWQLL